MRITLKAESRGPATKGELKRMRKGGLLPVTVSGKGVESRNYSVSWKELTDIFRSHGSSVIIDLKNNGESSLVLARDIQREPISGKIIHVGFQKISARELIHAEVRIVLHGTPEDVKRGEGVLEHQLNEIEISAYPDQLPEQIVLDVSNISLGHPLHVSDIPSTSQYTILTPPETIVASVQPLRRAVAEQEAAEEVTEVSTPAES
jgi:large subunit ribosomal protein L25